MADSIKVQWTERSLENALTIKSYIIRKFSIREAIKFQALLGNFEKTVAYFPTLYPVSKEHSKLRRAVLHKYTTVYYVYENDLITVVAMKDNRRSVPSI